MDLNQVIENDTGSFQLKHPVDGAPLGIIFTLAGPEHPIRQKLSLQIKRDMRRRVQRAGKLVLEDPEDELAQETDFLVACTLGWTGLEIDGATVAFDPGAARKLYEESRFAWVRRQVARALDDAEVFIGSSSKASSPSPSTKSA